MKISKHGIEKGSEREFYPEMMNKVLSGNYITMPSNIDENAYLVVGKADGKLWTIIFNVNTEKVITARRAHGKEVKLYEEKFGK